MPIWHVYKICAQFVQICVQSSNRTVFVGTFEGPGIYIYMCCIYTLYIYTRIYTRIYNRIHGFNEPNGPNESDEGTNRLGSNLLVDWTAEISPGGAGMENGHL